jgi:hypothetical protein
MQRNHHELDTWSLTGGGYAETILAHRISYNDMSVAEWGAAFVYWFPDFGDKVAAQLLPKSSYLRFKSASDDSFKTRAIRDVLTPALLERPREELVGHWIKTEILGKPITHGAITLPLLWRGLFVEKYWGILGVIAYTVLLIRCFRRRQLELVIVSLPVWLMAGLYAGISVSIPRYNIGLIPVFGISMAWAAHVFIRTRWRTDWPVVTLQ